MSKTLALAFGAALAIGLSGAALAQTEAEMAEFRRDCTGDYMRFCSAYDPSSAEVTACFRQNLKQLSPRCQATIAKSRAGARR